MFCFCWIKALSAHSDHCRTMGCRIEGEDSGPGRNGRHPGEPIPVRPGWAPSAHGLVRSPPASGGHPITGRVIRGRHLTRWTTSTRPELHRALRDGGWQGQRTVERTKRENGLNNKRVSCKNIKQCIKFSLMKNHGSCKAAYIANIFSVNGIAESQPVPNNTGQIHTNSAIVK